jgi:hypothetical protein
LAATNLLSGKRNMSELNPSFQSTRFTCPHCNTLAEQGWFNAYLSPINNPAGVPLRIQGADLDRLSQNPQFPPEVLEQKMAYWKKVNGGAVFPDRWAPVQTDVLMAGMEISVCHECMQSAIWLGGKIIYPTDNITE